MARKIETQTPQVKLRVERKKMLERHSDETFVFCAWLATGHMRPELNEINIAIWPEESY